MMMVHIHQQDAALLQNYAELQEVLQDITKLNKWQLNIYINI